MRNPSYTTLTDAAESTLLGALLLHRKTDLYDPICAFLDLLRSTFIENGQTERLPWREIQTTIHLNDSQLHDLFAAARAFDLFWRSLDGRGIDGRISFSSGIDCLQDYSSGMAFISERISHEYHPGRLSTEKGRNDSGQTLHYIEDSQLAYLSEAERVARQLADQIRSDLTRSATVWAVIICTPTFSALLLLGILLARDSGIIGIIMCGIMWLGVSIFGGIKWVFPKLTELFRKLWFLRHPAQHRLLSLLHGNTSSNSESFNDETRSPTLFDS